jgi:hypothetical protein
MHLGHSTCDPQHFSTRQRLPDIRWLPVVPAPGQGGRILALGAVLVICLPLKETSL